MKRAFLASIAMLALELAGLPGAHAALPVIDIDSLKQLFTQVQQMQQALQFAQSQLHALTNVPQQLMGQAQGLLSMGVSNPLQDIEHNLMSLMNGSGTGRCNGADGIMQLNQYAEALPMEGANSIDFQGAQLNGTAASSAGLLACTNQMMQATQTRLQEMPELLGALQSCGDITCLQGVSGRINYEQAVVATQTQQAMLVNLNAQQQRWNVEDQIEQKTRSDADQWVNATGGSGALSGGAGTAAPAARTMAPTFNAAGLGGG